MTILPKIAAAAMALALAAASCCAKPAASVPEGDARQQLSAAMPFQVGAERIAQYADSLRGMRVALYSNHTGLLPDGSHSLDALLASGVDVRCIFSPEHGFRGDADAGAAVAGSIDERTGLPIVSLYGRGHAAAMEQALDSIDCIITDIQDVGLRFYTYYCTMLELMDAAARRGQAFVVLDRPNPNGMYVDGPILDMQYASGVGRLPIPVVHGLSLAEMALMANGEGWLPSGLQAKLTVVPCLGYTHQTRYSLPVPPSPNLPNMTAIYLYPSLCFFEATSVSLGRGTDKPFQIYGHPAMKDRHYHFTPRPGYGSANPPQNGVLCHGVDLCGLDHEAIIARGIDLTYLLDAYADVGGDKFLTPFFEKLMGRGDIRAMIEAGMDADSIKATWRADVDSFLILRRKYLLYPE